MNSPYMFTGSVMHPRQLKNYEVESKSFLPLESLQSIGRKQNDKEKSTKMQGQILFCYSLLSLLNDNNKMSFLLSKIQAWVLISWEIQQPSLSGTDELSESLEPPDYRHFVLRNHNQR